MIGHHARVSTRISARMLALVLVPLLAMGWFATNEYRHRVDVAAQADVAIDEMDQISAIFALHSASLEERVPMEALAAGAHLGLSPDQSGQMLGVDLVRQLTVARARFDRLVAAFPDAPQGPFLESLHDLRARMDSPGVAAHPSVDEIRTLFDNMQETSARELVLHVEQLGAGASVLFGDSDLRRLQLTFERASRAYTEGTWQVEWLSALLVPGTGSAVNNQMRLRSSTTLYQDAVSRLDDISGPRAAAAWARVRPYDRTISPFTTATSAVLLSNDDAIPRFSVEQIGTIFRDGTERLTALRDLAEAAGTDLRETLVVAHDEANASQTNFVLAALAIVVLTVLVVLKTARGIVGPLRRLERRSREVSSGVLDGALLPVVGPAEVRVVTAAFNEAVANLQRVESVAGSLAAGDLSADALRTVPGGIGESLRRAVETLSASIRERDELQHRLRYQANHDHLTGLLNRRGIEGLLDDRASDADAPSVAVLFIDLDGFKGINDSSGHRAGDVVLRIIAKRLERALPDALALSRFGGDQWIAVLADGALDHTTSRAKQVLEAVAEPITAEGRRFSIVASIGIAFTEPGEGARTTIRNADLALSDVRRIRPGAFRFYDESLRDSVLDRLVVERELAGALRAGQLVVHYQPVVDAADGTLRGVEALVRWPNARGVVRPPDAFVPVAEQSDLIVDLDRYVLERAAVEVAAWRTRPGFEDLNLAVNISGRHLVANGFVTAVLDIVDLSGLDPRALTLEITETVLLDDLEIARENLNALRACGVRVAIDDFGTGYTSVHQLRSLPADTIKIDRSFLSEATGPEEQALVALVVDVGRALNLEVLAEGVETEEQLALVNRAGCDLVQGYLTGRPVPGHTFEEHYLRPIAAVPTEAGAG